MATVRVIDMPNEEVSSLVAPENSFVQIKSTVTYMAPNHDGEFALVHGQGRHQLILLDGKGFLGAEYMVKVLPNGTKLEIVV
jgi:hypothetical protein